MPFVNLLLWILVVWTATANPTTADNTTNTENITTTSVTTITTTISTTNTVITKKKNNKTKKKKVVSEWQYDDECTNECHKNDNRYWCGKYRTDPRRHVSRCVQYTHKGDICVDECGSHGSTKYTWCHTNYYKLDHKSGVKWWDTCSLVSHTINKEKCWGNCDMKGENYFWCRTSAHHKSKWDYCSPPGQVKPVQMHRYGGKCINQCAKYGQKYYWCNKSRKYCDVKERYCDEDGNNCEEYLDCDDDWEYCSVDDMHTRYGARCKQRCAKAGKSYYWCYTVGGSWDYCSGRIRAGVDVSLEIEVTRYNKKCTDVCSTGGYSYFWCSLIEGSWDYCSPENRTINNERCADPCAQRGKNYFWCNTRDSWDYCSPTRVGPGNRLRASSVNAKGAPLDYDFITGMAVATVLFLAIVFILCFRKQEQNLFISCEKLKNNCCFQIHFA